MTTQKVVAITGASNGMGKAAALLFAQHGWIVYGGARRVEKIPTGANIHAVKLDVTDSASNHNFIKTILAEQKQINILINNAGYGENGPVEDISLEKARAQFETNFFGAAELAQLALPAMRAQKSGRIINISSVGGDIYGPLGAYYYASKAALQQWSDTLDVEVEQFGVRSIIVQPGWTRSSWGNLAMENTRKNLKPNSVYAALVTSMGNYLGADAHENGATAEDLAQVFYAAATDAKPKRRYFNSLGDHMTVIVARTLPKLYRTISTATLKRMGKRGNK